MVWMLGICISGNNRVLQCYLMNQHTNQRTSISHHNHCWIDALYNNFTQHQTHMSMCENNSPVVVKQIYHYFQHTSAEQLATWVEANFKHSALIPKQIAAFYIDPETKRSILHRNHSKLKQTHSKSSCRISL